jgi:hypothetical protein
MSSSSDARGKMRTLESTTAFFGKISQFFSAVQALATCWR